MLIVEHPVNRLMIFARRRALIFGILLTGCSYFRIAHDKQTQVIRIYGAWLSGKCHTS